MRRDDLEALCAKLERELEERKGDAWFTEGPVLEGEPTSHLEWEARQRMRITEIRAAIDAA